ncbi:ubiquinone/menaquinone biosynthesis C-methylase UbiE [Pullulanibacillus pueri]|uniref:Methyltransferase domain-containing protein n=1 Tax=Pullulanibacillus pueri TaxID=1437324 RepID=A0A8J2ZUR2_9BACL|nr:class I SAM-dependent methyltransferase [Pullulanibacillus pueri]MBM7681632.1 ubiquinone/menaquinone biosynthesis C-methylase UbiE [Pullulanibacillus pueri]GGH79378.1 hypothetical protein GCM10007096_14210 [Pullulanibacillus pueri]
MNSLEKKKNLFNEWAKTYDQNVATLSGPLDGYKESLTRAAQTVPIKENESLLDIGIGTGSFAEHFISKKVHIHGIDLSTKMLEACEKKFPSFTLKEGVFTSIDYENESFQAVISSFCFHEVAREERQKACNEVYRVLKPGGQLTLLDLIFASSPAMKRASEDLRGHWDPTEDYALVEELDTLLYNSGFRDIKWIQSARCHWIVTAIK